MVAISNAPSMGTGSSGDSAATPLTNWKTPFLVK